MDAIPVQKAAKNIIAVPVPVTGAKEELFFRIIIHNRGFLLQTSNNSSIGNTLFLDTEKDIAQDLIFNEIQRVLHTETDVSKKDTKYVCPKCGKEAMVFEKDAWLCPSCKYKICHYQRSK